MLKDLYDALPSQERAFFLRKKTDVALAESVDEISSFLQQYDDNDKRIFLLSSLAHKKQNSAKYLLNSCLIDEIQNENFALIHDLLDSYYDLDLLLDDSINIIPFSEVKKIFQKKIEKLCAIGIREVPVFNAVKKDDVKKNKKYILEALEIIKKNDLELFGEIDTFIDTILLLDAKPTNAGTSVDMLGTMFLEVHYINHLMHMVEIIIHEASHMYLHFINIEDHLILNDPQELFESPYRTELRPMMGVFHATFVAARIVYFFQKLNQDNFSPSDKNLINNIIVFNRKRFEAVYPIVKVEAKATKIGRKIISTMPQLVSKQLV